jgi:hypothetical protein
MGSSTPAGGSSPLSGDDNYIAGWKTADDWRAHRATLLVGGDPVAWQGTFTDYFLERLRLRYLNPIRVLQEHGTFRGEGFSILALQCTLIEFFESTVQGVNYRYVRRGEILGQHEYSGSGVLFTQFLCTRDPFAREFDQQLADDFYAGIRCGLLHEARTKNGWRVWASGASVNVVDRGRKIVFRDNFQRGLHAFIEWYEKELPYDATLQRAFIRKFDSLSE